MSDTPVAEPAQEPAAVVAEEEFTEELDSDIWADEPAGSSLIGRMAAEAIGTFILVLLGVGAALLSGLGNNGSLTVGLAFGVAVIIGATVFAVVSGAHFNPAVSVGLWIGGRFPGRDVVPYILAQVVGALFAGATLYFALLSGKSTEGVSLGGDSVQGLLQGASNGWGEHGPIAAQGVIFPLGIALLVELLATGLLVLTILAATHPRAPRGVGPFAIGLALAILVVFAVPFTNGALNPARATATALFAGDWALGQLWLFWVAPILGAAIVGLLYRAFAPDEEIEVVEVISA